MLQVKTRLIETAQAMHAAKLAPGTAGNVSVRAEHLGVSGFWITPSGLPYDRLTPEDIVFVSLEGHASGRRQASSEWHLHRALYIDRAELGAVLHGHSPYATALAVLRREIPPFHYMIARFGGGTVRCAEYQTFGTEALAASAREAMQGRLACLLANHGMLVAGVDLEEALALGLELEVLCEQYWRASTLGVPVCLEAAEMEQILKKFETYGKH